MKSEILKLYYLRDKDNVTLMMEKNKKIDS